MTPQSQNAFCLKLYDDGQKHSIARWLKIKKYTSTIKMAREVTNMLSIKRRHFLNIALAFTILEPLTFARPLGADEILVDSIIVEVHISTQAMNVFRNEKLLYEWPVSTARPGKVTPIGSWQAKWLSKHHRSSRYNNAPMPYSIFYDGNFAVHGTNQIDRLGMPASAGCIRLHPDNAAVLFSMVQEVGLSRTLVSVLP